MAKQPNQQEWLKKDRWLLTEAIQLWFHQEPTMKHISTNAPLDMQEMYQHAVRCIDSNELKCLYEGRVIECHTVRPESFMAWADKHYERPLKGGRPNQIDSILDKARERIKEGINCDDWHKETEWLAKWRQDETGETIQVKSIRNKFTQKTFNELLKMLK